MFDPLRPHGLHSPWNSQARILECVAFPFSRGSSQHQGSNPGLLHCRRILYQLSHNGSPVREVTREATGNPLKSGIYSYDSNKTTLPSLSLDLLCLVAQSCPTFWNPWTVACQAPLSMGFSRQEHWSGVAMPSSRGFSQLRD